MGGLHDPQLQGGYQPPTQTFFWLVMQSVLGPVVQSMDNTIHRINHYPMDSAVCFVNTYPLDSDLTGG